MKKIILNTTEFFIRPFYRSFICFPFNVLFIKYPIYKQIQIRYNKYFSKYYDRVQVSKVKLDKEIKFEMLCRGDKGAIEMEIIVGSIYEPEITKFLLKNMYQNDIFIDIGANIGYFSLLASKILEKNSNIYSFEPVRETYERLQRNIELNKIKNIKTYNFALGSKVQTLKINLKKELGHNSIINNKDEMIGKSEVISVKRLDDFMKLKDKTICIKIDVEGYEFEVIKGMEDLLKCNNCKIVFEFTPDFYKNISRDYNRYCLDFLDFLKSLKFEIYHIKINKAIKINNNNYFLENLKNNQVMLFAKNFDY